MATSQSEHTQGEQTQGDPSDSWDAWDDCPAAELADGIGQLHSVEMASRQRMLAMVAAFDAQKGWKVDGATSASAWLVECLGVSSRTASEIVRVARALAELPAISAVVADGGLSWDQLAALTRFAKPADDEELARLAPGWSVAHLEVRARASRQVPKEEASTAHARRGLRFWWDERRRQRRFSGALADADGELVVKALERIVEKSEPDPATGTYDPYHQQMADALVGLARTRVADDADADRACVVVHVDADALAGLGDEAGERGEAGGDEGGDEGGEAGGQAGPPRSGHESSRRRWAETEEGFALAMETVRRLACDSRLQLVFDGRDGKPVGVGRATRTVPRWMARQLRRRDRGCRFPGCGHTRWLHAHHIIHWAAGGPTDMDNLLYLCPAHHRLVHEEGWRIEGSPAGQLVFVSPYGKTLGTGPPLLRPDVRGRLFGFEPPEQLAG